MNIDLSVDVEVTLSSHCRWLTDCPGPWNPLGRVGTVFRQEQDVTRVFWPSYHDSVPYECNVDDLIPLSPVSSRRIARDAARPTGLTVVDLGVEAGDKRWQVATREI